MADPAESVQDQIARGNAADDLRTAALHARLTAAELLAVADAIRHAPQGVAAAGRVLAIGGALRGVVGPSQDQDVTRHLEHALDHLRSALAFPDSTTDTGELEGAHAAARALLAIQLLMGRR